MTKKVGESHYKVGRIELKPHGPRAMNCGTFGVILGERAEELGHLEWRSFCEGSLKTSKWFAYRTGPGDNGNGTRTDLLKPFETKSAGVEYLHRRYGSNFSREF